MIDQATLLLFKNPRGTWERLAPPKLGSKLLDPSFEARVLFGSEPEAAAITGVRDFLYTEAEQGLRTWLSERRFIPRFLLATLVFGVFYFFLSFVIRDPIPILDELIFSLLASIIAWWLLGRRDLSSLLAAEMRQELHSRIDAIRFLPSEALEALEKALQEADKEGQQALDQVVQDLVLVLETMDEASRNLILGLVGQTPGPRLPRESTLQRWTKDGLAVATWKAWCLGKGHSPQLGLLALAARRIKL